MLLAFGTLPSRDPLPIGTLTLRTKPTVLAMRNPKGVLSSLVLRQSALVLNIESY